jgi:hypothetical protein
MSPRLRKQLPPLKQRKLLRLAAYAEAQVTAATAEARYGVLKHAADWHQAVANEYAADALKIQQDMEAIFEDREYADNADFALLTSLVTTNSSPARGGKRRCLRHAAVRE